MHTHQLTSDSFWHLIIREPKFDLSVCCSAATLVWGAVVRCLMPLIIRPCTLFSPWQSFHCVSGSWEWVWVGMYNVWVSSLLVTTFLCDCVNHFLSRSPSFLICKLEFTTLCSACLTRMKHTPKHKMNPLGLKYLGVVAFTYNLSALGNWGRRIPNLSLDWAI